MGTLIKIDDWLFDFIFQPLSELFQKITTKTNFFLAMLFSFFGGSFLLIDQYVTFYSTIKDKSVANGMFSVSIVIVSLAVISGLVRINALERYYSDSNNQKTMNPERVIYRDQRIFASMFMITMAGISLVVNSGIDFFSIGSIFVFLYYYFLACQPLPPGTHWFKKLLIKTLQKINSILPEPVLGQGLTPIPIPIRGR